MYFNSYVPLAIYTHRRIHTTRNCSGASFISIANGPQVLKTYVAINTTKFLKQDFDSTEGYSAVTK